MKKVKPDDYFTDGIMELARFGKQVVMKNHMSSEQHKQWMSHLKEKYLDTIDIVNEKIRFLRKKF